MNQNDQYKIFVRFKPLDYIPQNIQVQKNNIQVKMDYQEKDIEYDFEFQNILDEKTTQRQFFDQIKKFAIEKALKGYNSCILSYGQTQAGKSYSIFGEDENYTINTNSSSNNNNFLIDEDDRRGLVPRAVQYLLEQQRKIENSRTIVLTCSIYEIYLDQVRDLIKNNSDMSPIKTRTSSLSFNNLKLKQNNYENEDLEIQESSNGQMLIKSLNHVNIKSMQDLYNILHSSFTYRSKYENKNNQISARAHTVFTINIIQKDKINEQKPFINSTINFVDLAGCEKTLKNLNEGQKFQESLLINNNLNVLGKVLFSLAQLQGKSCPYKESKLTKVLQNSLTVQSNVVLISCINPGESCVEETINNLQFCDRTKNQDLKSKNLNQLEDLNMNMGIQGNNKLVRKLNEEYGDLKSKLENLHNDYRVKLVQLQNMLGIEYDLGKILTKPSEKEIKIFKSLRESFNELQNRNKIKQDYEKKHEKLLNKIESIKQEDNMKSEKYLQYIKQLQDENFQIKEQLYEKQRKNEEKVNTLEKTRKTEIDHKVLESLTEIEKKSNNLFNRSHLMLNYQGEFMKQVVHKRQKKSEEERNYKLTINSKTLEYQQVIDKLKQQYEEMRIIREQEILRFGSEQSSYAKKQLDKMESVRNEMIALFHNCSHQKHLIQKIESGQYSQGIVSCSIPQKDIPIFPHPKKFIYLEKILEERKILRNTNIKGKSDHLKLIYMKNNQQMYLDQKRLSIESTEKSTNINNVKEDKLIQNDLIPFAQRAKQSLITLIKESQEYERKLIQYTAIEQQFDIKQLQTIRDQFKELYLQQWKINNKQRACLESQRHYVNTLEPKQNKSTAFLFKKYN